jgi:sortase B
MMDGSMFNNLLRYDEKKAWEKNSIIQFDTLYEKHEYEIFAVFKTTASIGEGFSYHQFVDAQSEEEFDKFIATCKQLAFYDTGITPEYGDKVICLSTCEYTLVNGRFVVCAVRIS